jgi:hypothetical protein
MTFDRCVQLRDVSTSRAPTAPRRGEAATIVAPGPKSEGFIGSSGLAGNSSCGPAEIGQ